MQYNRMLHISTAGSRKATQWPESAILWSEFLEKLKTPVRSTESLEEYLAYPKARQDELKDVSGLGYARYSSRLSVLRTGAALWAGRFQAAAGRP